MPMILGLQKFLAAKFFFFFGLLLPILTAAQQVSVTGQIKDSGTGDPLEFANVSLLQLEDSTVISGTTTGLEGRFDFTVTEGVYLVRVSYIGYELLVTTIEPNGEITDLGSLYLRADAEILEQITVTGVVPLFRSDIDKRTYDVENTILAEGATASELLNTLPSIQINEEGGITMRGSGNVLIYINGRPTNLSSEETESILAQFPANSIKSIELITNPSARYDAQGVGGIINLVLKKEERSGTNGQVSISAGTRDKYQGSVSLNHRTDKFNIQMAYNDQLRNLWEKSESLRHTFDDNVSPFLDQDFHTRNTRRSRLFRTGVDYQMKPNILWGIYGQYNLSNRDRLRIYNQRHLDVNHNLDSLFTRTLTEDQQSQNIEVGTVFTYDIDTLGQRLYTSFSYADNHQTRTEYFDQLFYNAFHEEVPMKRQDQIYGRPASSGLWIFQMDYSKPMRNGSLAELGLKSTISTYDVAQTFDQLNLLTGMYEENRIIANEFPFDEEVHAAYAIYRNKHGKLGYQAGLRAEQTRTSGWDRNTGFQYDNQYFNAFPSIYFTYELSNREEINLNFSRRINRPNWGQMAPFYNAQDLLNTRFGNPVLQPEYTNSYEVGFNRFGELLMLSGTVYHRTTFQAMTRIYQLLENNAAVQLWDNAERQSDTGFEWINRFQFHSSLDATLTGNFFYSEIDGRNLRENFQNSNFSWTINFLTNWVVKDVATIQIMVDYRGPIILPQGKIDPIWGLNMGIKRDLLKKRASLSLNVSDIFNTRMFRIRTDDTAFSQMRFFNQETRIGTLTFSYNFGGFKSREETRSERYSDDPF